LCGKAIRRPDGNAQAAIAKRHGFHRIRIGSAENHIRPAHDPCHIHVEMPAAPGSWFLGLQRTRKQTARQKACIDGETQCFRHEMFSFLSNRNWKLLQHMLARARGEDDARFSAQYR
jgi:hypothetical protein